MRETQRARRKEQEIKHTRTRVNERKKHKATAHICKDRCGKAKLDPRWRPI